MDILIVDDDPDAAEMLHELLSEATRLEVKSLGDGEATLRHLGGASRLPRLILLDLRMRPMSGWAVLECLRASPRWRGIPVIVMTGSDDPAERIVPVVAFMRKPLDIEELLRSVVRIVEAPPPP